MGEVTIYDVARGLVNRSPETKFWEVDAPYAAPGEFESYEYIFHELIQKVGITTFVNWLMERKQQGSGSNVLDLFGSGWFVENPEEVDAVIGFRLGDSSSHIVEILQETLSNQSNNLDRNKMLHALRVIERFNAANNTAIHIGNIYSLLSWNQLYRLMRQMEIDTFDLIIAKPEGAFYPGIIAGDGPKIWESQELYQIIFLRVLERAYKSLSTSNGILIFQIPNFAKNVFNNQVLPILKHKGIEMYVASESRQFLPAALIRKNSESPQSIEDLLR